MQPTHQDIKEKIENTFEAGEPFYPFFLACHRVQLVTVLGIYSQAIRI